MARIRSLHPGQWTDEDFVECSAFGRLLVLALRNEADDNGVFEWKPAGLKMRLLPADAIDINDLLAEIQEKNQVRRFEVDGRVYGAIRNFRKWQRPEKPKAIHPLPDELRKYVGLKPAASPTDPRPGGSSSEDNDDTIADQSPIVESGVADLTPSDRRPVADQSPTDHRQVPELGEQRKEEGGRREEEKERKQQQPLSLGAASAETGAPIAAAASEDPVLVVGQRVIDLIGLDPARWTGDYSAVRNWLAWGFDPDLDILPAIGDLLRRERRKPGREHWRPGSLQYFNQMIIDAHARRMSGKPLPSDGIAASGSPRIDRKVRKWGEAEWAIAYRSAEEAGHWPPSWGPAPGEADHLGPGRGAIVDAPIPQRATA